MAEFVGSVCLITGAAGGLGKVIAETFILAKAKIVIVDINAELLKTAETELSVHGEVLAYAVDLTDEDAIKGMFSATVERFGKLDILINNAGINDLHQGVATLEKSFWDAVLAVNLTAPYLTSKYAVNHFLSRDPAGGRIVNIGSLGGMKGGVAGAAYVASKHGLIGLTKNTAAQYGKKNVRCNAVLPAMMQGTGMTSASMENFDPDGLAIATSQSQLDLGWVDIRKVAATVRFLCSDDSGAINGSSVATDNGRLAY